MADAHPLAHLPRRGTDHLGPCIKCGTLMLATGMPLFYRVKLASMGIDGEEVRRHVGLAAAIAPGRDGLALAGIMGPEPKPVVVMDEHPEVNVCHQCIQTVSLFELMALLTERPDRG